MIPQETIDYIKSEGFKVYMRGRNASYAVFENASGIGYIQYHPTSGHKVCTIHVPNIRYGTGFLVATTDKLTRDVLETAVTTRIPSGMLLSGQSHPRQESKDIRKYKDMESYKSSCTFNSTYEEV